MNNWKNSIDITVRESNLEIALKFKMSIPFGPAILLLCIRMNY